MGSGNGLLPSDNKPLNEPIWNKIYVTIWCHKATMNSVETYMYFRVGNYGLILTVICATSAELL